MWRARENKILKLSQNSFNVLFSLRFKQNELASLIALFMGGGALKESQLLERV